MNQNKLTFIETLDKIGAANPKIKLDFSFSLVDPGNYSYAAKQIAISIFYYFICDGTIKPYLAHVHGEPVEVSKDRCLLQWEACVKGNGYSIEGVFYFRIVGDIKFYVDTEEDLKQSKFKRSSFYVATQLIIDEYLNEELQRKREFRTQKEAIYHFKKRYPHLTLPDYIVEALFNAITSNPPDPSD
jgi:hypothetical protein